MINDQLAARYEHLQIERILRAEVIADLVSSVVDDTVERVLLITQRKRDTLLRSADIAETLQLLPDQMEKTFEQAASKLALWSFRQATQVLTHTIPRKWFRKVQPATVLVGEDKTPDELLDFDDNIGPVVGRRLTDAEWEEWVSENVFAPPSAEQIQEVLERPVAGRNYQQRIQDLSKLVDPEKVAGELIDGFAEGLNVDQLTKKILPRVTGNVRSSARRIARTESLRVANEMQREMYKDLGDLMVGTQVLATLDQNTRPHHALRNGRIYYRDGRQPDESELPVLPDEPNCVLPGNLVEGRFCAGSEARYSGKAIQFTTTQGRSVTVTPNHPIFTLRGFVAAKDVLHSDQLVCNYSRVPLPVMVTDNHQHPPTAIEKVFRALVDRGSMFRAESSPEQFHGDGRGIYGQVNVIGAFRSLRSDRDTTTPKDVNYLDFGRAVVKPQALSSSGAAALSIEGVGVSTTPVMSSLQSGNSVTDRDLAPFDFLSFGAASVFGPVLQQQTNETERTAFVSSQPSPGDAQFFSQLVDRLSGVVATDNILDIRHFDYNGHVYDLQSDCGTYFAGGILLHNCRCFDIPVMKPPADLEDDPEIAAEFRNASREAIPDPQEYGHWFQSADEGRRKLAVGVRRYNLVKKSFGGSRDPEWTDFIDGQGKLMSIYDLVSETSEERLVRKGLLSRKIDARRQMIQQIAATGFEDPTIRRTKRVLRTSDSSRDYGNRITQERVDRVQTVMKANRKKAKQLRKAIIKAGRLKFSERKFSRPRYQKLVDKVTALEELDQAGVLSISGQAELKQWWKQLKAEVAKARTERELQRKRILPLLRVPDPVKIEGQLPRKTLPGVRANWRKGQKFLSQIVSRKHAGNGRHGDGQGKLKVLIRQLPIKQSIRSFYSVRNKLLAFAEGAGPATAIHELGHVLEEFGEVHELVQGFLHHRLKGETFQQLNQVLKTDRFDDWEEGGKDKFHRAFLGRLLGLTKSEANDRAFYTGKHYIGATEVLSMGAELLYDDPIGFAQRDPEWFDFTVGILRGDLLP